MRSGSPDPQPGRPGRAWQIRSAGRVSYRYGRHGSHRIAEFSGMAGSGRHRIMRQWRLAGWTRAHPDRLSPVCCPAAADFPFETL